MEALIAKQTDEIAQLKHTLESMNHDQQPEEKEELASVGTQTQCEGESLHAVKNKASDIQSVMKIMQQAHEEAIQR